MTHEVQPNKPICEMGPDDLLDVLETNTVSFGDALGVMLKYAEDAHDGTADPQAEEQWRKIHAFLDFTKRLVDEFPII